jgi:hypothetical protein
MAAIEAIPATAKNIGFVATIVAILKMAPKASLAIIGESLGLDHATVIHSLKNFDFYAKHNPTLDQVYFKMLRMLPKEEKKKPEYYIFGQQMTKEQWDETKRDFNGIPPSKDSRYEQSM